MKLDIDRRFTAYNLSLTRNRIEKALRIVLKPSTRWTYWCWKSPGGNIHVEVNIFCSCRLRPMEIVALQSILGSDWRRESFNFVRAINCRDTRLFQKKYNILFTKKVKK